MKEQYTDPAAQESVATFRSRINYVSVTAVVRDRQGDRAVLDPVRGQPDPGDALEVRIGQQRREVVRERARQDGGRHADPGNDGRHVQADGATLGVEDEKRRGAQDKAEAIALVTASCTLARLDVSSRSLFALIERVAPTEAAEARSKTGLSQPQFAELLGVSVRTLQEWEQGRRTPSGAARSLLHIAAQRPDVFRDVLSG